MISRRASHWLSLGTLLGALSACTSTPSHSAKTVTPILHTFEKITLSHEFWSEGACFADINHDGKMDDVSGPFWYEGPSFTVRHAYSDASRTSKSHKNGKEVTFPGFKGKLGDENEYSANFFAYSHDFNEDGWADILILGFPGENSWWFENPGRDVAANNNWKRHVALEVTDDESPRFADINGDGRPDIVCASRGSFGYAEYDPKNPTALFKWHAVTPNLNLHKFTHGLGVGDVDGDGRMDLLEKDGWWQQPKSLAGDPVWVRHAWTFGTGGAQMYAYDVNRDGLNDVITSQAAHGYGLSWYEQYREGTEIKFREHSIMNKEATENRYGVHFSQLHAIDLIDMDGDGLKDIVTGKRFWAHGPAGDPEPNAAPVVYWFQLKVGPDHSVDFIPHLVDDNSGTGTEIMAQDYNGDGRPDLLVGNKHGVYVFRHQAKPVTAAEYEAAQPKPLK